MAVQEEKLQQEILEDAERKARRSVDRAKREATKLQESAKAEHEKWQANYLLQAQRQADERERALLASIDNEKRRYWLQCQEQVLQEVVKEAMRRLTQREAPEFAVCLQELLRQALVNLDEAQVCVQVPPGCRELFEKHILPDLSKVRPELLQHHDIAVGESAAVAAGLMVESVDGRRRYDNRLKARYERLKAGLRAELLEILSSAAEAGDMESGTE